MSLDEAADGDGEVFDGREGGATADGLPGNDIEEELKVALAGTSRAAESD